MRVEAAQKGKQVTAEVDIFKLVLVLLAVVVVTVLVPLMLQLLRTLRQVEATVAETRQELTPLLRNLRESSERLNRASAGVEAGVEQLHGLFTAIGEVRDGLHRLGASLQHGIGRSIGEAFGFWFGLRQAQTHDNPEGKGG